MATRRPISINNSLVHGICNYRCRLCGIGREDYEGPRELQPHEVTRTLVRRVREAAASGLRIRYVANSGDGEPTLHPDLGERMRMFGEMLATWDAPIPPPEVSLVTNGSRLTLPGMIDPLVENRITLIVSLPTCDPASYGLVMRNDEGAGPGLLATALEGIGLAMELRADGRLSRFCLHISPPEREIVRRDFAGTIDLLTRMAGERGLERLELVLFPAVSNRSGLLRGISGGVDTYRDLFRRYRGRRIHGVTLGMTLVLERFLRGPGEIADLVRCFDFPCLWNANFFISSDGSSICCNDQARIHVQGNILEESLETLMAKKESFLPGPLCARCNQSPSKLRGSPAAALFSAAARVRLRIAMGRDRNPRAVSAAIPDPAEDFSSEPRLVGTFEEIRTASRLLYDCYLEAGLQVENPERLRLGFHNLLPSSYPILAEWRDTAQGTLTVVRQGGGRLPMDDLFGEALDGVRRENACFCELSGLAVDPGLPWQERRRLLLALFRKAFVLGHDLLGCTDFCMMTHPRHSPYYRKVFGFEEIGGVRPGPSVGGAPAVPLRLDLRAGRERLRRNDPKLWSYFFGEDIPGIRERTLGELRRRCTLNGPHFVGRLGGMTGSLLENLSPEERHILDGYYPGWEEARA